MPALTHRQFLAAIDAQAAAVPVYSRALRDELFFSMSPQSLVTRVDTRTLQASEAPFSGAPESGARGLTYGEGNAPLGASEARAVADAAGTWGTVGYVNDAKSTGGFPYGIVIEAKDMKHQQAHDALPGRFRAEARRLWSEALRSAP